MYFERIICKSCNNTKFIYKIILSIIIFYSFSAEFKNSWLRKFGLFNSITQKKWIIRRVILRLSSEVFYIRWVFNTYIQLNFILIFLLNLEDEYLPLQGRQKRILIWSDGYNFFIIDPVILCPEIFMSETGEENVGRYLHFALNINL